MVASTVTRATLAALSAGAPLSEAFGIGAKAGRGVLSRALESAGAQGGEEGVRQEAIERLPFEPQVVGLLIGRAKPEVLQEVAELARRAMEPVARSFRFHDTFLILASAMFLLGSGSVVRAVIAPVPELGIGTSSITAAQLLACSAIALLAFQSALQRNPPWRRRRALSADRLLFWLAAGELAGVRPAAIALGLGQRPYETVFQAAPDAHHAARLLLEHRKAAVLIPMLAELGGESCARSLARVARVAALARDPVEDRPVWLRYLAMILVVIGCYLLTAEVYVGVSEMGRPW